LLGSLALANAEEPASGLLMLAALIPVGIGVLLVMELAASRERN
jgi:hypothetical protein